MMQDEPWAGWRARCETLITSSITARAALSPTLAEAMQYACLNGGKRIRPLLVYATGTALGADESCLDAAAVAVELIHAYSLVHDDLPAMDDDDLRRGKPTVHVAYDEATAILVGDGLQALAFEVLSQAPLPAEQVLAMLRLLTQGAGMQGMVAGQAIDLGAVGKTMKLADLQGMHAAKTGALIRAAVGLGALTAGADEHARQTLDRYAQALGLAFQIRDDMLDVEGDTQVIGKTAGKDAAQSKPTYPALLGLAGSRQWLETQVEQMHQCLQELSVPAPLLARLADFAAHRQH